MKVVLVDGSGGFDFESIGYPNNWKLETWRDLPENVVRRLQSQGYLFRMPSEFDAESSRYIPPSASKGIDGKALTEQFRERYKTEKWIRVVCPPGVSAIGDLAAEFAAIDRPPKIGVGEILELPESLIKSLELQGIDLSSDEEVIAVYDTPERRGQAATSSGVREWQDERAREKVEGEQRAKDERVVSAKMQNVDALMEQRWRAASAGNVAAARILDDLIAAVWRE